MHIDASIVGQRIKTLREALGLSQRDFGKLVGVRCQRVCQWEVGRSLPRVKSRLAIAKVLQVAPEVLFSHGEARDGLIDDKASTVMLEVTRAEDATLSHKLTAAKSLRRKPSSGGKGTSALLEETKAKMDQAHANLDRLFDELLAKRA